MDSVGQVTGLSSGVAMAGVSSGVSMAEGVPSALAMGEEEGHGSTPARSTRAAKKKVCLLCQIICNLIMVELRALGSIRLFGSF